MQGVLIAIKYLELLTRFIEKHTGGLENRPRMKKLKGMMLRASQGIYGMPHLQNSIFTKYETPILSDFKVRHVNHPDEYKLDTECISAQYKLNHQALKGWALEML